MKDAILKGTGNSRYLKSVAEFLKLYPTYPGGLDHPVPHLRYVRLGRHGRLWHGWLGNGRYDGRLPR